MPLRFNPITSALDFVNADAVAPLAYTLTGASAAAAALSVTVDTSTANQPAILAKNNTNYAHAGNILKVQMLNGSDSGDVVKVENAGTGYSINIDDNFKVTKLGAISALSLSLTDRLYLNSTAYIDGISAGVMEVTGTFNIGTYLTMTNGGGGGGGLIRSPVGGAGLYLEGYGSGTSIAALRVTGNDNAYTDDVNVAYFQVDYKGDHNMVFQSGTYGADSSFNRLLLNASYVTIDDGDYSNVAPPTATLNLAASTTSKASLRIKAGTAPTSPNDGEIWYDGSYLKIRVGTTTKVITNGTIFDHYADSTVGGAEADIYTDTLPANTFAANGDKVTASYGGNFVTVGTELTQLKVYLAGTAIWDSTGVAPTTGTTSWRVVVELIRVSATVVRYTVALNTTGASGFVYCVSGELTGLTLSGTNILKVTGTSSGVGSGSGDIVGKMGSVEWKSAV